MKKLLPYILILLVIAGGIFSFTGKAQAEYCNIPDPQGRNLPEGCVPPPCPGGGAYDPKAGKCVNSNPNDNGGSPCPDGTSSCKGNPTEKTSKFYEALGACSFEGIEGCVIRILYLLFYSLPSYILYFVSFLFDITLTLTLSSAMYSASSFIPEAWRIVRDFSNIFFILVLLYVAIKMILGFGGAEIKKMIASVVVAALLINFSMFMTQVVIDSSNILALIFYNKITIDDKSPTPRPPLTDSTKTKVEEKSLSAKFVDSFDITKLLNPEPLKETSYSGPGSGTALTTIISPPIGVALATYYSLFGEASSAIPFASALIIIVTAGAIFLFASYAFFIAAISFLGRLIELWLLIIFSPFAFMSFSVPKLKGVDYLGWDSWLKRLVSVAFMAPIFMFFMLLISKIIQADMLGGLTNEPKPPDAKMNLILIIRNLLLIAIPAIINLTLLWKATEYAKKGGGEFGQALVKYGQAAAGIVGGLAIGAASGGVGLAATATLGRAGAAIANNAGLKRSEAAGGLQGFFAGKLRDIGKYGSKSSFDLRKAPGFSTLAKSAGLRNVESTKAIGLGVKEGGWEKTRAEQIKKHQERARELEVTEDEPLKQALNNLERDQQELLRAASHPIELLDRQIKGATEASNAAAAVLRSAAPGTQAHTDAQIRASDAANRVTHLRTLKSNIKNASGTAQNMNDLNAIVTTAQTQLTAAQNSGVQTRIIAAQQQLDAANAAVEVAQIAAGMGNRSINHFEDVAIPHAHHDIQVENRNRKWAYSENISSMGSRVFNTIFRAGNYSMYRGVNEAAHKIRMEVKLDGGKDGGH